MNSAVHSGRCLPYCLFRLKRSQIILKCNGKVVMKEDTGRQLRYSGTQKRKKRKKEKKN